MIRKILNYVSEDGWKWAIVVVAISTAVAVANDCLVTWARIEAAQNSLGFNDSMLEMEEVNHALVQLGAGELAGARQTLETRLESMAAMITAQIDRAEDINRTDAIKGLLRVAQSQQAHPEYYPTGWRITLSDADKHLIPGCSNANSRTVDIHIGAKENN